MQTFRTKQSTLAITARKQRKRRSGTYHQSYSFDYFHPKGNERNDERVKICGGVGLFHSSGHTQRRIARIRTGSYDRRTVGIARKRHFAEFSYIRNLLAVASPAGEVEKQRQPANRRIVGHTNRAVRMRSRNCWRPFATRAPRRLQPDNRQSMADSLGHNGAFPGFRCPTIQKQATTPQIKSKQFPRFTMWKETWG